MYSVLAVGPNRRTYKLVRKRVCSSSRDSGEAPRRVTRCRYNNRRSEYATNQIVYRPREPRRQTHSRRAHPVAYASRAVKRVQYFIYVYTCNLFTRFRSIHRVATSLFGPRVSTAYHRYVRTSYRNSWKKHVNAFAFRNFRPRAL